MREGNTLECDEGNLKANLIAELAIDWPVLLLLKMGRVSHRLPTSKVLCINPPYGFLTALGRFASVWKYEARY